MFLFFAEVIVCFFCSENSAWVPEAPLNNGRAFGVLTQLDGKLHIIGGNDDHNDYDYFKVLVRMMIMISRIRQLSVVNMTSRPGSDNFLIC